MPCALAPCVSESSLPPQRPPWPLSAGLSAERNAVSEPPSPGTEVTVFHRAVFPGYLTTVSGGERIVQGVGVLRVGNGTSNVRVCERTHG
jgi:hypothetical protein